MLCPYCSREMEKGLIQSPHEIAWLKGEKKRMFGRAGLYGDSVVLSELNFVKGSAVIAYLCRSCQKVIIDYADARSDCSARHVSADD